ncbi:hypothetical protein BX661DRAFT_186379 [Kickxella alabastrina]|uniref:uncharacterized protein n=1 Tax=Kickxella alabastrina TaxID=61397 RepID=UPI00221ED35D|nr:uncharacterized protein BX661DRAFT_186379 [Kickxella alabastrina]KAI7823752.1 hypothetical protein BX661DRAFT_186379 [Kickxella alabastrina]
MGTLSAQLAHLFYIGDEASTPNIKQWSLDFLNSKVIPWAQHADLIWPTIDTNDQVKVLAQARHTYEFKTRRILSGQSKLNCIYSVLESDSDRNCQCAILHCIICNPHAPDIVRVAAIHQLANSIRELAGAHVLGASRAHGADTTSIDVLISDQITRHLQPQRYSRTISDMNSLLAHGLVQLSVELPEDAASCQLKHKVEFLAAAKNSKTIGLGLALLQTMGVATSRSVSLIVREIFLNTCDDAHDAQNSALFAAAFGGFKYHRAGHHAAYSPMALQPVATISKEKWELLQRAVIEELTTHIFMLPDNEKKVRLVIPLNAYLLAVLASRDQVFRRDYILLLVNMNSRSQAAVLRECLCLQDGVAQDTYAGSEDALDALTDKWNYLSNQPQCRSLVAEFLRDDHIRFENEMSDLKAISDHPVFKITAAFWDSFYRKLA